LDATLCDAHGICALCCPERITLDRWGYPDVSPEPVSRPHDLRRARRAVHACPESALSLEMIEADGTNE
jgi:ferredoxin